MRQDKNKSEHLITVNQLLMQYDEIGPETGRMAVVIIMIKTVTKNESWCNQETTKPSRNGKRNQMKKQQHKKLL